MRGGTHAQLVRLVHGRAGDVGRHAQHARLPFDLRVEHAARDEQLHVVARVREARANDLARLLGRARHVGEQARAVTARHGNAHAGRKQPRSRERACVDGVAHLHVGEPRIAHRAHRGHAACQLLLRVASQDVAKRPPAHRVSHHAVYEATRAARAQRLA